MQQTNSPAPQTDVPQMPSEEQELVLVQIMNGIAFSATLLMFGFLWSTFLQTSLVV